MNFSDFSQRINARQNHLAKIQAKMLLIIVKILQKLLYLPVKEWKK